MKTTINNIEIEIRPSRNVAEHGDIVAVVPGSAPGVGDMALCGGSSIAQVLNTARKILTGGNESGAIREVRP
jgi:hypothetical protein